jgi:hypothetical protein
LIDKPGSQFQLKKNEFEKKKTTNNELNLGYELRAASKKSQEKK